MQVADKMALIFAGAKLLSWICPNSSEKFRPFLGFSLLLQIPIPSDFRKAPTRAAKATNLNVMSNKICHIIPFL